VLACALRVDCPLDADAFDSMKGRVGFGDLFRSYQTPSGVPKNHAPFAKVPYSSGFHSLIGANKVPYSPVHQRYDNGTIAVQPKAKSAAREVRLSSGYGAERRSVQ
jgi:hypothetical protein